MCSVSLKFKRYILDKNYIVIKTNLHSLDLLGSDQYYHNMCCNIGLTITLHRIMFTKYKLQRINNVHKFFKFVVFRASFADEKSSKSPDVKVLELTVCVRLFFDLYCRSTDTVLHTVLLRVIDNTVMSALS